MNDQIHPKTHTGPVRLVTPDLERASAFYTRALGFTREDLAPEAGGPQSGRPEAGRPETNTPAEGTTRMARFSAGGTPLLELVERPGAGGPNPTAPGLYHFAVLYPSREALGAALRRVLQTAPDVLEGAADHGVSEAVYLHDPDGNGIEIYRDRPRANWPTAPDGSIAMTTDPLDLHALLEDAAPEGEGSDAVMGHVHLQVNSIPEAVDFYTRVLGLELMQRFGPSAAFLSAGGYHHHVGMNVWRSRGQPPAPEGAAGLAAFTLLLPTREALEQAAARIAREGAAVEAVGEGYALRDPSGNRVELRAESDH